ncbi:recombinase family protein [Colibacter massiliensis]|uniref:recombinase family protein n=1 Tax=Colibacter massiliensis TaxID=1852379 RepID=UPI00266C068B|nr:recombinase family protein [Colibacter massiliensis]
MSEAAVIYARYSSDRQREESIEGQIRVCKDYARRNGLTILHTYVDRAMTGRTDRRPEFQMMIQDAATQNFEYVLVCKLNRFARNRYDSTKYKHKLKKYGVKVVSAMENIANDSSGILLESVIEGMAEYYSAELAENVMRGMTENALECKWTGGPVPLGYKLDESHHLIIDEPNAVIVRKIYQMVLDGHTPATIIRELNQHHYLTSTGRPFSYSSLRSILYNERYTGTFIWHKIRKPNAIPPIVDDKVFQAVQEKLKYNKENHIKKCSDNYLLTGKLYCGLCGSKMSGTSGTSKNRTSYYYYTCTKHHQKDGCHLRNVRADILEDIVCEQITRILSIPEAVKAIAKQAIVVQQQKKVSLVIQSLKNQIADANKKLQNCVQAIESGLVSDTIINHVQSYEKRLKDLKAELSREELLDGDTELTEEHIEFFFYSITRKLKTANKYKSILLSSLVRCVIIYDEYVEIQYNYKYELPILQNPVQIGSSYLQSMVIHPRLELGTP